MSLEAKTEASRVGNQLLRGAPALLATFIATLLTACSSGNGGTDVTIGSGQSADPVTLEFPVFYVKRPVPDPEDTDVMENDAREPLRFEIGADLYMRDRASPSSPEINLTHAQTEDLGDIRDLDVNYDGTKVVFSMRAKFIENADEEDQPTWNIWEYDTATKVLRRIIQSDTTAEEGHDIMPYYLPDGRIVFSSTRQRQARAILLDENKPQFAAQVEGGDEQPAFVLHVMDADGSNINQITYNQSHDLDPAVLNDGRILYTHWEQARPGVSKMDLYAIRPDGSDRQLLYGAFSHATGTIDPVSGDPSIIQFLQPRAMADGRTLALIRPFTGTEEGGDLVLIDTANYVDNTRGATPANLGLAGPAQTRALPTEVRTVPGPSPGGRYRSASPLFDGTNRLLVSWSQCRLIENDRIVPCTSDRLNNTVTPPVEAPPLYGIYIYDVRDSTQKPIVIPQEGFIYTEVVSGSARPLPPVLLDRVPSVDFPADLVTDGAGVLHIRSVYDVDGADGAPGGIAAVSNPGNAAYANRPARFLRVEKFVSRPDEDTRDIPNTAFGVAGRRFGMREILGYAPVEPDGSVKVKVPANVAFAISVIDKDGKRLSGTIGARHTSWLQVMPGETLECNGCHNANVTPPFPHGRKGQSDSVNTGATSTGGAFPGTNPVLGPLDMGETMAQARGRAMCGGTCDLSVDIAFDDYWQPGYNKATTPGSFDMCYGTTSNIKNDPADGASTHACTTGRLSTVIPTTDACRTKWTGLCRIVINYEQIIHPLWKAERFVDVDGVPGNDLDPATGLEINHKCNTCHSPTAADGTVQIPAGDIDLTDGPSEDEADQFKSYRELLFTDVGQTLDANGQPVDECVQTVIDPVTLVETCVAFRQVPAAMSGGGARASGRFFTAMASATHRDFMSPSELRLISEWLDIGAQYYNDPFLAPED